MAIQIDGDGIPLASLAPAAQVALKSGRKNLIINGGFEVSQRGDYSTATTASNVTYYLDRFKAVVAGGNTVTHKSNQLLPNGKYVKTLLHTMTAAGYTAAQQFVEDYALVKGQEVTLSAWVKSNVSTTYINIYDGVSVYSSTTHTGGGAWEKLSVTATLSTSISQLRAECFTGTGRVSGDYFEISQVQLELGDTATDFEHRSYGEELSLCERYFQKLDYDEGDVFVATGYAKTASETKWVYQYHGGEMRAAPTISETTVTSGYRYETGGWNILRNNIPNKDNASKKSVQLGNNANTVTANEPGRFRLNAAGARISFDAEL